MIMGPEFSKSLSNSKSKKLGKLFIFTIIYGFNLK